MQQQSAASAHVCGISKKRTLLQAVKMNDVTSVQRLVIKANEAQTPLVVAIGIGLTLNHYMRFFSQHLFTMVREEKLYTT
jgi:hypothetical protein